MVQFGSERKLENRWRKKMKDDGRDAKDLRHGSLLTGRLLSFSRAFFHALERAARQSRQ